MWRGPGAEATCLEGVATEVAMRARDVLIGYPDSSGLSSKRGTYGVRGLARGVVEDAHPPKQEVLATCGVWVYPEGRSNDISQEHEHFLGPHIRGYTIETDPHGDGALDGGG